ncbi:MULTISPECIES: hypothetical protein [unclassified Acetobacterium]|jgi:hypothetical protein|uniref:hypothetical protein n=1 Tax=unclassified Acetobacterium TaxID=2638182 RepID=UPI000DBEC264|nr:MULTISPECIES: hypothetical protein [unclassified Acetobacterium]AWW28370.1 hypothetical protein DOZ58_17960 [Acetobacterium sp. KB-1]MDZ5726683.1 hypothetical protein [Acetobacterium sp. K1/6]
MEFLKAIGSACLVFFVFVIALFLVFVLSDQILVSLNEVFAEPYYQMDSTTFEMIPPQNVEDESKIQFSKIQFNANLITMVLYPTYHVFMADFMVNEATTADKYLAEGTFINPENQTQYTIRPIKVNGSRQVKQIQILIGDEVIQILNKQ